MIAGPASPWGSATRVESSRSLGVARRSIPGWLTHSVALGAGVGLALTVAWAFDVRVAVVVLASTSLVVAFLSPAAGLAIVALLVPLREIDVFAPIGYPVLLVLATGAGVLARQVVADPRPAPGTLMLMGVGYLLLAGVTIIPVVSGLDGRQTSGAIYELLQLASGFVVVAVGMVLFRTEEWRPYLRLVVIAAVVASALAIYLVVRGSWDDVPLRNLFSSGEVTRRAVGPFHDANHFSLSMAVTCVLAIGLARDARGCVRVALMLAAVLIATGPIMSFGRGGLLALGAGLIAVASLRSRRLGVGLALAIGVALPLVGPRYIDSRLSVTTGGLYAQPTTALAESDSFRFDSLVAGLKLAAGNPALGVGFGQFRFRAEDLVGANPTAYPHDTWIKLLAEQGIAGAAMFAALIVGALRALFIRRHLMLATAVSALVAYAVGATFLEPLVSLQTSLVRGCSSRWPSLAAGSPRVASTRGMPMTSTLYRRYPRRHRRPTRRTALPRPDDVRDCGPRDHIRPEAR